MDNLIEQIKARQSIPLLQSPSPSSDQWREILAAACTAPDHGRLRPWQFRLIEGDDLKALGQLFLKSQKKSAAAQGIELTEQQLSRTQDLPLRAPAILVVVAQIQQDHKIPVIEQIAATAAATQNAQLALSALGFGCMWRTGDFASDTTVKQGLGFEEKDEIIGFLYVGTPQKQPPARAPQDLKSCFQQWHG